MSQSTAAPQTTKSLSLPVLSEHTIYVPIAILMIVTLQFQTLPFDIPIQTLPLTTIVALIAFPFLISKTFKSPLLSAVILFATFALVHSLVALLIDLMKDYPDTRFIAWVRQCAALLAGVITFYAFRVTLVHLSLEKILRWIVIGSLPALLFSLLNVLWGAFKIPWAEKIVIAVREFVSPMGYTSAFRASGFAVEPAALATIIVLLLVPVLLVYLGNQRGVISPFWLLGLTVIVFVWTFSISGFVLLFVLLGAGMVLGPMKKKLIALFVLFFSIAAIALLLFPSNQVLRHARSLAIGQSNLSVNDRLYGVIGPFLSSTETWSMVGYGLGGVSAHFHELIPSRVQAEILAAKWKEYPTISSLFGRTFAETGAIGLVLFLVMFGMTFWELHQLLKHSDDEPSQLVYACIRLALIAVFVSLFVSIGPYHTPYFWFWMAVVDAQFILMMKERHTNDRTL